MFSQIHLIIFILQNNIDKDFTIETRSGYVNSDSSELQQSLDIQILNKVEFDVLSTLIFNNTFTAYLDHRNQFKIYIRDLDNNPLGPYLLEHHNENIQKFQHPRIEKKIEIDLSQTVYQIEKQLQTDFEGITYDDVSSRLDTLAVSGTGRCWCRQSSCYNIR